MTTPAEDPSFLLTRRQRQVLLLCANGFTTREIGRILFIAYNTVKRHIQNVLSALQAKNVPHAILLALRLRELDPATIYPTDPEYAATRYTVYQRAA